MRLLSVSKWLFFAQQNTFKVLNLETNSNFNWRQTFILQKVVRKWHITGSTLHWLAASLKFLTTGNIEWLQIIGSAVGYPGQSF